MEFSCHILSSVVLARAFFARSGWPVFLAMLLAGTLADTDALAIFFGPSAYLTAHYTSTHSLPGTLVIVSVAVIVAIAFGGKKVTPVTVLVLAASLSAISHLFFDLCQSDGVVLFWPIRVTRIAADYIPAMDFWILGILLAGIALPELFRLVSSEIGAKEKAPRGRNGALIALGLLLVYAGARAIFHERAVSMLEAHTYQGESARHYAAFPDSLSVVRWRGLVETSSTLCQVEIPLGPQQRFDPEALTCFPKAEPSPALAAAQNTPAVRRILKAIRFPRAVVQKSAGGNNGEGYEVGIRSLADVASGQVEHSVAAQVILDANAHVLDEELVWVRDLNIR